MRATVTRWENLTIPNGRRRGKGGGAAFTPQEQLTHGRSSHPRRLRGGCHRRSPALRGRRPPGGDAHRSGIAGAGGDRERPAGPRPPRPAGAALAAHRAARRHRPRRRRPGRRARPVRPALRPRQPALPPVPDTRRGERAVRRPRRTVPRGHRLAGGRRAADLPRRFRPHLRAGGGHRGPARPPLRHHPAELPRRRGRLRRQRPAALGAPGAGRGLGDRAQHPAAVLGARAGAAEARRRRHLHRRLHPAGAVVALRPARRQPRPGPDDGDHRRRGDRTR